MGGPSHGQSERCRPLTIPTGRGLDPSSLERVITGTAASPRPGAARRRPGSARRAIPSGPRLSAPTRPVPAAAGDEQRDGAEADPTPSHASPTTGDGRPQVRRLHCPAMTATEYEAVPGIASDRAAAPPATVVMKFGGTSVGDPEKVKAVAQRLVAAREGGNRVVGVLSAMGRTTDDLIALAHEVSPDPGPARAGHAGVRRRTDHLCARGDGDPRSRARGDLAHRLAGRDRHRHDAHEGEDRRGTCEAHPRGARRREDRPRRRLPGRLDGLRRDDARPRRHRPHGRRARLRARRARVRDLHRRRRRLHRRPAHRPGRAQAPRRHLRRDAGDGGVGREGAAAALGRVRTEPRRHPARPLHLLRRGRDLDHRGGRPDAREGDDLRGHAHDRGDALPRRRRACGPALPRARRRERQRRHDRADRRRDRLLRAGRGPADGRARAGRARRDVVGARRPRQGERRSGPG